MVEQIRKYYCSQIHKNTDIIVSKDRTGETVYMDSIKSFLNPDVSYIQSSFIYNKLRRFNTIKYCNPIYHEGYICQKFDIDMVIEERKEAVKASYCTVLWKSTDLSIPQYIVLSSTFISKDGEYRHDIIRYDIFLKMLEFITDKSTNLERILLECIDKHGLMLVKTTYSNRGEPELIERLEFNALLVIFIQYSNLMKLKSLPLHSNENYLKIVNKIISLYPDIFSDPIFELKYYFEFKQIIGIPATRMGIKFTPLYERELLFQHDLNYPIWKETHMQLLITDLLINQVTSGLAIFNNWSILMCEDLPMTFFENSAMMDKYKRSIAMVDVVNKIREARQRMTEKDYIENYYTDELDSSLYETIEYGSSRLILSNCIFLQFGEYTNMTFNAWINYVKTRKTFIQLFSEKDSSHKLIFEVLYTLHCMHSISSVCHSDIHLNNVTIDIVTKITEIKEPKVLYALDPGENAIQSQTLMFDANEFQGTVIDFSRSVFGPGARKHMKERLQLTEIKCDLFYMDQTHRVIKLIAAHFPQLVEQYQLQLKALINTQYEKIFPILCHIDYISFCNSIKALIEEADDVFKCHPDLKTLVTAIAKQCIDYLIKNLISICNNEEIDVVYPGSHLLTWFKEFKFKSSKPVNVIDLYKYKTELKYATYEQSKFPPAAIPENVHPYLGQYTEKDVFGCIPCKPDSVIVKKSEHISAALEQELLAKDGVEKHTQSSWIDF